MAFRLIFSRDAAQAMKDLEGSAHTQKKLKRVRRALGLLQRDPRYPGLRSHQYSSISGINGEKVWDSYVENNTPSAWRIFWHYGPDDGTITILMITPHP